MDYSILFPKGEFHQNIKSKDVKNKSYFEDLALDLIFDDLIKSKKKFGLEKYYYEPLEDIESIYYRQEIMRELEDEELRKIMTDFSNEVYFIRNKMDEVRKDLSSDLKGSNNYLTRGHMLDYAERYCHAITKLNEKLSKMTIHSEGLLNFISFMNKYVNGASYQNLMLKVKEVREEFSAIEYVILLKSGTIKVAKYEGQKDYSRKILTNFDKFRQGDVKDYRQDFSEEPRAKHIEAAVLDLLSKLYEDTFNKLVNFCTEFNHFDDEIITQFSQEIQFYITWLDYILPLKKSGLPFNYPKMVNTTKHIYADNCFDIALATEIKNQTVTNDFTIEYPENIIVVTGPNQGGKTTFAKTFGQIHYLASIGLCVPGESSSLYMFDDIFTHFGREEDLSTQDGKLKDDLERLFEITDKATNKSLIIINEIFSSTTLDDAVALGGRMMDHLTDLKAPSVIVTFLDELALHDDTVISMMSTVEEDNPMKRTYKVVRKTPEGSAHAIHIASKHGLTYEKLYRRLHQ